MKKQNKIEDKNSTRRESRKKKTEDERKHNKCKWYDWSTERDFYRKVGPRNEKGERTKILERRAICRCEQAKAFRRLVMGDKVTSCPRWKEGKHTAYCMSDTVKDMSRNDENKNASGVVWNNRTIEETKGKRTLVEKSSKDT